MDDRVSRLPGARLAGPAIGLLAQALLLATLAVAPGLGRPALAVGAAAALAVDGLLARALVRHGTARLGAADWITLARASLAVGVAALTAEGLGDGLPAAGVALTAVALALDPLDGLVARRTGTATALGARMDGEVDAFLILVLSIAVAPAVGAWVLLIGAARYAFLVAGWLLPWMRAPLGPRYWRKVVAAVQGITLLVVAADVLPLAVERLVLLGALALLAESFGRDTIWLVRHRHEAPRAARPPAGPVRRTLAGVLTALALLLVWAALLFPDRASGLDASAFLRIPLEGLVLVAVAIVLPRAARRVLAVLGGVALALLLIVKVLDIGFVASFDRPFNPVDDWSYAGIGVETLGEALGPGVARAALVAGGVLLVLVLVLPVLALLRLTRVAAERRRPALVAVLVLALAWVAAWATGVALVGTTPVASSSAATLAVEEGRAVRTALREQEGFAQEIARDRSGYASGDGLLAALRGKDVLLLFVESYGKIAVQDSPIAPRVDAVLADGTARLDAAGFDARTGWLTSPTFGGISWLAHSTLQSGTWVNSQRRYDELIKSDRFTLSRAFGRAGWRTVDIVPANNRDWPEGSRFYRWQQVYDRRHLGYRGPGFAYAPMPDQFVLSALDRLELGRAERAPLFAEVDLVSSHTPWTRIPTLVPWEDVGDGSIYDTAPVDEADADELWSEAAQVQAAFGRSIEYTLETIVQFLERQRGRDLVVIVLGDHQPATVVAGVGASHDVPVAVIANDPGVLARIGSWGWQPGLRPGPDAPVWPMSDFRDRFLDAFGNGLGS